MTAPVLVVIDMQEVFASPASGWSTPGFPDAELGVARLLPAFRDRVVFTRFTAPEQPQGAWARYYEDWPFALVPPDDPLYDLVPAFRDNGHPVVTETTFGKWGPALREAIGGTDQIVLAGVSTDCCVLSTALPAADAGVRVRVAADACAGLTAQDHQRALDAMALYAPLIEIETTESILRTVR